MALFSSAKRLKHDPLSFVSRRSIRPGVKQTDLMLRQKVALAEDLYPKDLIGHFGCVNAIEFSHGLGQFIGSGGDDRRVLLWNVEKALSDIGKPVSMKGEHNSNIFCVAFDITNSNILSGGNDEQVIVHDMNTGETKDVFTHEDAVYGLSPDPTNPSVFASSCDDGRVLIYDMRDSCADPFCLANYTSSMHSVMYNPVEPRLLATANAKEGVGLWDVRKPRSCLIRYGGNVVQQSCMSVRFNHRGDHLIALRRRLPPVMYRLHSHQPVCEFDHSGYYNSCTMKSISFAGDNDQYVLSGSDEFNLYMWAIPEDLSERAYINSAHLVLKGHRSIVNQVRFNPANHLILSSGVEKIIKAWSPFKLPTKTAVPVETNPPRERPVYSHEEYINLVLQDGHVMSHDYSHESTEEDPRMMAFFDSLVQRELEGWSSDDSLSSNEEELFSRIVQLSQSDIDSDDSLDEPTLRDSDDEDTNFSPFTIAFASVMASQAADGNDKFPRLNAALSLAERNAGTTSTQDSSDDQGESGDEDKSDTQTASEAARKRDISEMVKKKKKELKDTLQRHLKDCKATLSSCSESDQSDDDTEDKRKLSPKVIKKGHKSDSSCLRDQECKKQAQLKIKRLRSLRQSILNSESDKSDVEISEKQVTLEVHSATSLLSNEPGTGIVQFKKLSKSHSDNKTAETKDYLKSRGSPDRGPYLQKKNITATLEAKSSTLEENKHKKGKSSTSQVQKGKKLKSEPKHKSCVVNFTSSSKHMYVSPEGRCQRRTKSAEQTESAIHCDFIDDRNLKPSLPERTCTISTNSDRNETKRTRVDDDGIPHSNKKLKSSSDIGIDDTTDKAKMSADLDLEQPSCSYSKAVKRTGSADDSVSKPAQASVPSVECKSSSESEEDSQPTWTEFKHFRNKLEKAQRHYREHRRNKKASKRHYSDDDA